MKDDAQWLGCEAGEGGYLALPIELTPPYVFVEVGKGPWIEAKPFPFSLLSKMHKAFYRQTCIDKWDILTDQDR